MVLSFTQLYNSYAEMSTFANTDFLTNTGAMFYTRVGSNLYKLLLLFYTEPAGSWLRSLLSGNILGMEPH